MRRAALSLFGTLIFALFVATPAAAECTTHQGDVSFTVCDDRNGNAVPDQADADTPAGGFSYHEAGCSNCPGVSALHGSMDVAGMSLDARVMCHGAVGQPQYDCWFIRAHLGSPVAQMTAGNVGGAPPGDFCYKISWGNGNGGNVFPIWPTPGCVPLP